MRTWREYYDVAEHEHARITAQRHYGLISAIRTWKIWLPAVLLGAAGLGVWQAARHAGSWLPDAPAPSAAGFPAWAPVAAVVLLVLTVLAFRPGRVADRLSVLAGKVLILGVGWLALVGFTIGRFLA